MNEEHAIFSHQIGVVRRLAEHYENISVLTTQYSFPKDPLPSNVEVFVSDWKPKQNFRNAFRVLIFFLCFLRNRGKFTIFSHMTEVHSAIIAPISTLLHIPHFLWYAHTSKSSFLIWDSLWVDKIITSTRGSCPISNKKVVAIGQGVDERMFHTINNRDYARSSRWIHVGRLDPSKRIDWLIKLVEEFQNMGVNFQLKLVGTPSVGNNDYFDYIQKLVTTRNIANIYFLGSLNAEGIQEELANSDLFIHAFQGSLDKVLVEATLHGIPVVTCNKEYLEEFAVGKDFNEADDYLLIKKQLKSFLSMPLEEKKQLAIRTRNQALINHSISGWILRLINEM